MIFANLSKVIDLFLGQWYQHNSKSGGMAEWSKAAVLKTVEVHASVGSNPTPSATLFWKNGEMAELAEGARLLSE